VTITRSGRPIARLVAGVGALVAASGRDLWPICIRGWNRSKSSPLPGGIRSDTLSCMNTFLRSDEFDAWLATLKDKVGRARIVHRIRSAEHGNFGDCEPVGEGVSEMRIHFGPGYRVYFTRRGEVVYLLLLGGGKSSQKRDIKRAIEMARALDKE
jgi:putative addiction module killer protein